VKKADDITSDSLAGEAKTFRGYVGIFRKGPSAVIKMKRSLNLETVR